MYLKIFLSVYAISDTLQSTGDMNKTEFLPSNIFTVCWEREEINKNQMIHYWKSAYGSMESEKRIPDFLCVGGKVSQQ